MSPINVETMTVALRKFVQYTLVVVVCVLGYKLGMMGINKFSGTQENRKNAICPALLSISRSARDTLIVMKAEPLCNSFVLDNLK